MDMSIQGVGLASSLSNLIIYISLLNYTTYIPEIKEAVQWPNKQMFRGIIEYLSLGFPSAMMLCLEWWAFEAMTLLTGYIGVDEQAAQIIMFNIIGILFMFALGI